MWLALSSIRTEKEVNKMAWQLIVALVLAIPIIVFPVAFVWYINISGLYQVMREARQRQKAKAVREKKPGTAEVTVS